MAAKRVMGRIAKYLNIVACHMSGQMSERQWNEHLRDGSFAAWFAGCAANNSVSTGRKARGRSVSAAIGHGAMKGNAI